MPPRRVGNPRCGELAPRRFGFQHCGEPRPARAVGCAHVLWRSNVVPREGRPAGHSAADERRGWRQDALRHEYRTLLHIQEERELTSAQQARMRQIAEELGRPGDAQPRAGASDVWEPR